MEKSKNTLSRTDELIIESYKTTMEGLAAYYGEAFEIVLHDLTDLDHSIIKIVNGSHSGRKRGAPITDFALSMLEQIKKNNAPGSSAAYGGPFITYLSSSKYGKPVRSTTIVIFGEKKKPIGLLCINLYLDSPLVSLLRNFSLDAPAEYIAEHFINDSDELIARSLEKVKSEVLADGAVPVSQKNKEIVTLLYYQGIFKLKDAVQTVSRDLGISKNTVYLHIRALDEKT
ncbi:MAG: PAS domain-containing protein [Treponema sp.]|jgi:predicted transcriptional regulator YheO|nr:PAS domain-containing protein [Treponema sp.]